MACTLTVVPAEPAPACAVGQLAGVAGCAIWDMFAAPLYPSVTGGLGGRPLTLLTASDGWTEEGEGSVVPFKT